MNYKIFSKTNLSLIALITLFTYFSYMKEFFYVHMFNIILTICVFCVYIFLKSNDIILYKLIVYLMFFDINDLFTFGGSYNFRLWYIIILFLIVKNILYEIKYRESHYQIKNLLISISIITIALLSVLINGSTLEGFMFILKQLIFYFTILYFFIKFFKGKTELEEILHFFTSMVLFSTVLGIVQMFFLFLGVDILYSPGTMRPQAFFSETTWYSEYANIGILIALLINFKNENTRFLVIFLHCLAVVLSMTRNSILGLVFIIFYIVFIRRSKTEILRIALLLFIAVIGYSLALTQNTNLIGFDFLTSKFNLTDDSALGRIGAINENIKFLSNPHNFFWGSGFSYTESNDLSGSAIGAKSFNLILAIFSSGGFFLFALFSHIIGKIYLDFTFNKNKSDFNIIGIIIFSIYILYSMSAPFHFYPLSWFVLAISIVLISYRKAF